MKRIKVLHIWKDFNIYDGLAEILVTVAKNIDHDMFDLGVCAFSYECNVLGDKFEDLGGKIYSLDISKKLYNEPREFAELYRFLKKHKPDIVQTYELKCNLYGIVAAKLAGVPIIIGTEMTAKDTDTSIRRRLRDRIVYLFVSMSLRNCDEFIVTSKFIMNQWCQHKYINKFNVIYPPFNFEKYKAAMNPEMAPETNGVQKIGFVGRLSEEKGIHSLLRSMVIIRREMPDARLVIVGTGPLEDKLKVLVSQLQLNSHVEFTGFKENVFEMLRQLDIFVLPSRIEGCPISVLEAMAIGLPVVATNIGGNPELVRDGETGLLIPYNNPDRLAQAVLDLLQDKEKANTMGLKGQEVAFAEFHPSKFVKRLEDLYYRLYSEKS